MNEINNLNNITNIKLTSARKSILELLIDSKKPLSYEDMKENISMDKATFYRNITILKRNLLLVLLSQMIRKGILKFQKHHIHTLFVHLAQKLNVFIKK